MIVYVIKIKTLKVEMRLCLSTINFGLQTVAYDSNMSYPFVVGVIS